MRYLAADFGPQRHPRQRHLGGPVRTLAGAGITDARLMFTFQQRHAPLRRAVSMEEVGGVGALSALRPVRAA